ncbi:aldehyde dehydrogenase family protein [Streptomyces fuscichromogenes]|uniref:aldehyde dehydrogenase family protein n=1 Tax=Streptomyces fuscichromogenes TaxID=1324013 RepID=UPI0037F18285
MNDFHLVIDGAAVPGDLSMPVINPATGKEIYDSPRASRAQLDAAVSAAHTAFPGWAALPIDERRTYLRAVADVVEANSATLAHLVTEEQGKPLAEARREVGGMVAFFRYGAGLELPERTITDPQGRLAEVRRLPLGPVAAVIPWNFPLLTIAFKIPSALLAGNTVVIKPAPTTPLSTLRFAELVAPVLPKGVLNVIVDDNDLGDALVGHPLIRKVTFTGSTATGRRVMANAAETLKRLTLELGGNDCAIVLDDVDPKEVAQAVYRSAFQNNGQVCLAIKRLYVHDAVHDEVCAELARLADAAVVGNGLDEGTDLGPVQNAAQFAKLRALLDDAREHGEIIAGGRVLESPGYFLRPTIVRDIREGCALVDEEQFGPILPVIRYSDVDEVLRRANATDFGLGASVWSGDTARAKDVARRVEAGTVWINKHADIAPHIPFGGMKSSGIGLEFAQEGLAEFTQVQVISGEPE